jgi:lysophospholipase L1-like esterase
MSSLLRVAAALGLSCALVGWAQNPAVTPVPRAGWWMTRHDAMVERAKQGGVDLLFVGDSITQNYEKPGPAPDEVFLPSWQEYFSPHHALNLGYSGDTTQNVLWRLQHGEVDGLAPKDIVLLIGTNNTNGTVPESATEVAEGVEAVVGELHTRIPAAKITVIEILPSGISAAKSAEDAAINAAVAAKYAPASYVRMLDLTSLFVKDGVLDAAIFYDPRLPAHRAPLHPDTVGQRKMAAAVSASLYPGAR